MNDWYDYYQIRQPESDGIGTYNIHYSGDDTHHDGVWDFRLTDPPSDLRGIVGCTPIGVAMHG